MNTENNKPDHYSIVAKDNSMIEHLAGFKLAELRLIAYCLAHYDTTKPENRVFFARVSDLVELFPINEKSAYRVVEEAMEGINKKPLKFKEGRKKHFWNWFSGFIYDEGSGEFEFRITPEIQPYLLNLAGSFTKYRLGAVYQFKSAHTWKLYENLKKEAFKDQWSIGLDELKLLLGIAGKYSRFGNFEARIISPAVSEINENSDLEVSYKKRKKGRSVVGVVFQIQEKPPEDTINVETSRQKLRKMLAVEGIADKTIDDYIEKAEKRGKIERCVEQLPKIAARWTKEKGPKKRYLLGSLRNEIEQMSLFENHDKAPAKNKQKEIETSKKDAAKTDDDILKELAKTTGNKYYIEEAKKRGLI